MSSPASLDARLLAEAAPGDNAPALSVSELSGALKRSVEDAFGHVRVRGEISGFKRVASGHCYLTLKDDRAVIDGVIWKGNAGTLAFRPEDGVEVIATGKLTTYPGRSKYQIVIDRMEIAGAGALMALLDQRRRALAAEGLFDADAKRALPFLPRVIGVVTSPTGAVIRDILHRLADRCPTHVLLWPVIVQGEGAAAQIAAAVRGFDALPADGPIPRPDLVIVARGGGSIEDLWAFNEEAVVRAVAACTIPTISAVGHETDTTLCDFAADRRAPTPTAAAEMAVPVRAELRATLRELGARTARCANRYRDHAAERLAATARRLPAPDRLLGTQRQRLDDLGERLPRALSRRLALARGELAHAAGALRPRLLGDRIGQAGQRLAAARFRPVLIERSLADRRALLADQRERLPRAFSQGLVQARGELAQAAAALRPRLLADRLARDRAALARDAGRLPEAFGRRLTLARGELAHVSATLRPRLLADRAARSATALGAVRLRPALVERPLAEARTALDRLWRLAESLAPDKPLQRGYAWVERRQGGVVATAAAAKAAGALVLHFADGKVAARVERGGTTAYVAPKPEQPTLL
ncbi:exodeoxyribonuclease VII large subunit [Sphingomonas solaris]|uniref:Exodeoxyribonuclease 7 large subunit n=1 Tax=Alterirhizorhabdus solaris TaxID=2529389 RepID=A0A558RAC8_9SPHN|nr:exodeoxyribonuclease VII large subunit [Sphingomonas solaris]TVV76339.1 exodeoxyribonuclease VII large subunit [Sphingomonas solaris]